MRAGNRYTVGQQKVFKALLHIGTIYKGENTMRFWRGGRYLHFGLKSQASLAKRHCSNNMVPTAKILMTVVIKVGVVRLGGRGSGMQVGHGSAWRLEQPTMSNHAFHQSWTNTSFTRARDNSFVHQDSIVCIVSRTSHMHLWC